MYDLEVKGDFVYLIDRDNKKKVVGYEYKYEAEFQEYSFSNTEGCPYHCDYNDINNFFTNKIPNNVSFSISNLNENNEVIEELKVLPYPFNFIRLIKNNNKVRIILSSCTEGEEWSMRWSIGTFFDQLANYIGETEEFNVIIDENRNYQNEKVSLEFKIKQDISIKDAIKYISEITNKFINEVEISLTGLSKFQEVLNIWKENKENMSEDFWQTTLTKYSWVIGQSFSLPLIIFHDKAYMGGKDISNKNGGIIDFVYRNKFTSNIALVEIKTPQTPLIGVEYRQSYTLSNDLSGAINQVLLYKDSCQKDFASLSRHSKESYEPFNPKCLLIIGRMDSLDEKQKIAFELFRNELKSIEIITFDELFKKIEILLDFSRDNNI